MNTKHLKAKILDLAIRGKLVPQDSSEGNAADLLQKIREEKLSRHPELDSGSKQKKIKEDKNASFIIKAEDGNHYEQFADGTLKDIEDEIPFEIPENWCWTKMKTVSAEILYGVSESAKTEGKYKLLRITDIQNNKVNWEKVPFTNYDETTVYQYLLKPGDLVFARTGATVGKSFLIEDEIENAIYASYLIRVRPSTQIDSKYIKFYFQSRPYWNQVIDRSLGNGQPNVNGTSLANLFLPLPPLSEQQRIVSAIEKAFEQIDIIEKNKLNLKTYIKQTKSKVLDLAIHGKLVDQNPQEGNAFELLEKIRNEKATRHPELDSGSKQKKLKEEKGYSFIITKDCEFGEDKLGKQTKGLRRKHYEKFADGSLKDVEEEIPFEIPENWCWCRLTSICEYGKCKNADPSELLPDSWILDLEDIEKGTGVIKKFPTFAVRNSLSTKHVFTEGTVLYSKLRPYLNKVVIAPKDGFCTSEILPLDFNGAYVNKFAQRLLMSPYFLSTVNMLTYGVKMPRLGTGEANQILLPLPPLSEQKRIVTKIEQIFEQLDVLEKSLGE